MQVAMGVEDSPDFDSLGGLLALIKRGVAEAPNRGFKVKDYIQYF